MHCRTLTTKLTHLHYIAALKREKTNNKNPLCNFQQPQTE